MLGALSSSNSPFSEGQVAQLKHSLGQLDSAQSAWLSGYLAGCLARPAAKTAVPVELPSEKTSPGLEILYGSETGNGEGIARALAQRAQRSGIASRLYSLEAFRPSALKKIRHVVFVISTHGDGDPPEGAIELFDYLRSAPAPDLSQLNYGILALGDRSYSKFCGAGRQLDTLLQALGARSFATRVECDIDYETSASAWVDGIIEYGARELANQDSPPAPAGARLSVVPETTGWTRQRPFSATVQRVQKITGSGSTSDVHHIELSLAGSGIHYQPGDALGVWAANAEYVVQEVLTALRIDPAARIEAGGETHTMRDWLREHRELTRLTPATVESYANLSRSEPLQELLPTLDENGRRTFMEQRQFIDLVEEFPGRLRPAELLHLLRPLSPRSYSIASSQAAVDDEVHLTVATRLSEASGPVRRGVASNYLNHRLQCGDRLNVFVERNERFRLPADRSVPLILVAAGTGIAPYRAFLQQLEEEDEAPEIWLIFGNPHLRTDFLYQREWLRWRATGLLRRIDTAFSRDQREKYYVQHVVAEQSATIIDWLGRGAHLYVCGGLAMGREVERALLEGMVEQRRVKSEAAAEWLREIRQEKRLLKDLY